VRPDGRRVGESALPPRVRADGVRGVRARGEVVRSGAEDRAGGRRGARAARRRIGCV
jgi:hypothetical protein